jgi:hypothetical protein
MPTPRDDEQRWRALASEAHAAAQEVTDHEAKRALLFIAAAYERLARRAEKRINRDKQ